MRHSINPSSLDTPMNHQSDEFHTAFQHLVGEIFRLNGRLLAVADRLGRDLDITPARWQAMGVVQQQPMTVSDIGRRLGIKRQSVQPTVNKLVEQGILRMKSNPNHRRAPLAELTPFGREVWERLLGRQEKLTQEFTSGLHLAPADLERLSNELRALRRNAQQDR